MREIGLITRIQPRGDGVITKLYYVIFATFKESMTLNFAQRSFKVIDFGTNRKRVYTVINSSFYPILHRFRDRSPWPIWRLKCRRWTVFLTPLLFRLKFGSVPFGVDCDVGSAEIGKVWLISSEIIFQKFQVIMSMIPERYRHTDRRTDRQVTMPCLSRSA